MSEQFKPLSAQIADKMIAALKAGNSIFQKPMKPDGKAALAMPYNPTTGINYTGPAALVLLMKGNEDPRWMSYKQASFNKTPVEKEEKGTLIQFFATNELRQKVGSDHQPEVSSGGKPVMERVELEQPTLKDAWLFNAAQLRNMPELNSKNEALPEPLERAKAIIDATGASLVYSQSDTFYNPESGNISVKDYHDEFEYFSKVMEQMPRWAAANKDVYFDLPPIGDDDEWSRRELRANIAAVFISSELNLGMEHDVSNDLADAWVRILTEHPSELFNAADDAQVVVDYLVGFEQKIEIKEEVSQELPLPSFGKGDVIGYNNTLYEVEKVLANKSLKLIDQSTGAKLKVAPTDGLYASLLNVRQNSQEAAYDYNQDAAAGIEMAGDNGQSQTYSRKR
ncbi:ArdC-like ssDNA-binding domain-containing protein [Mucilaginibacter sp. KACC 22773]|uniref:ArdC-like ssDNA-binding domain-containing protein n=1 Tax=Mucilaginibacter sp. KACC 22773 TaxID=3025671 RepID=UPI00236682A2|nr:ArdC-like ssDNA-binding domain-containing protein [Mucilaginibacter sp. KACC 22773]WDF80762.1 ArdC-like ssDNA-binding domain-containing protein [Mucilaginibacter sp. KACC 22773]